jgi:hypothetical protein
LARWLAEAASAIERGNQTTPQKKSKHKHSVCQIKAVSANDFFLFLGIIIISGAVGKGGKSLFEKDSDRLKDGIFSLSPLIGLSPCMSMRWFEDIKSYFPQTFADFDKANPREANHDPWYMLSKFIAAFNDNRAKLIAASVIKLLDEPMSAWVPRKD